MTTKNTKNFKLFSRLLKRTQIELLEYDTSKTRSPIKTRNGSISTKEFKKRIDETLGRNSKFQSLIPEVFTLTLLENFLRKYCEYKDIVVDDTKEKKRVIPPEYRKLTLNMDHSHQGMSHKFFMTTPDEYVSEISGKSYLGAIHMSEEEAVNTARKVIPVYEPRKPAGLFPYSGLSGESLQGFNTYVPPDWVKEIPNIRSTPELPKLFSDLVKHLFPIEFEQEYFYSWLYYALYERAQIFLILCGPPGVGKNTLQAVIKALAGVSNFVNGKKSSLNERFNANFAESTVVWFDELKHTVDNENTLKELPNEAISIEKKGVDATRSTEIHASFIITNNKPRDNYIAFDARKFAALMLNSFRLEKTISPERIDKLLGKCKRGSETYDPLFLAKIAQWILINAKRDLVPNLEYRGPMFWRLAHTSMSRWQKTAATLILSTPKNGPGKLSQSYDKAKGFKWSLVEEESMKKKGRPNDMLTDYSTVKHFFDVFRDGVGDQVFKTSFVKGDPMGDFYVKVVKKDVSILNEADVLSDMEGLNGKEESNKETRKEKLLQSKGSGKERESIRKRKAGSGSKRFIKIKNLARSSRRGESSNSSGRRL